MCLAASPGGHLSELEFVVPALARQDTVLVTVASAHASSVFPHMRKRFIHRIERNPADFLVNSLQSALILLQERPDVVISTGAGDVVPLMMIAASLGIAVVFLESVARVHTPSLTGRLVKRWTNLILIPWPELRHAYPRGISVAPLMRPARETFTLPPDPSVLVLTGTGPRGFERLLRGIDQLVLSHVLPGRVFAQIGSATYLPQNYQYQPFLPHDELMSRLQACDLVITHDGAGSIRESLSAAKPIIVVPHQPGTDEIAYRSSAELARHLARLGWVLIAEDPTVIPILMREFSETRAVSIDSNRPDVASVLREFLASLENRTHPPPT